MARHPVCAGRRVAGSLVAVPRRPACPASPPSSCFCALLLLAACEEEILPPEPEPADVVALVLSGYLEFEPDTVRVSIGDTLVTKHHPSCEHYGFWSECKRWHDPPEAGPGQVLLTYRRFSPKVIGCLDAAHYTDLLDAPAGIQFLCSEVIERYQETRPDSPLPRGRVRDGSDGLHHALRPRRVR